MLYQSSPNQTQTIWGTKRTTKNTPKCVDFILVKLKF